MIILNNITKKFKTNNENVQAIRNINLTINQGENVCFIGKSGSGKTTLLDIIGTLLKPTEGIYKFEKEIINHMSEKEISSKRLLLKLNADKKTIIEAITIMSSFTPEETFFFIFQ